MPTQTKKQMVFYWCLSNTKSPQVSSTLLRILADLKKDLDDFHLSSNF